MLNLICKDLLYRIPITSTEAIAYFFSTSTSNSISKCSNSIEKHSLALSYLINTCGLPLESANSASKKLHFKTTDQPDSVLTLLKTHGLTQTNIKNLITNRPTILLADANKTVKPNIDSLVTIGISGPKLVKLLSKEPRILHWNAHEAVEYFRANGLSDKQISELTMKLPMVCTFRAYRNFPPKLEFFKSLGFSSEEIAIMVASSPYILAMSLENQIKPTVEKLRRIVGTNADVLKTIKGCFRVLRHTYVDHLQSNIDILIDHGVPESNVMRLINYSTTSLLVKNPRFTEVVEEVMKFGIHPTKIEFILGIRTMGVMSKSRWGKKVRIYCSFGLSEADVITAFRLQPMCMLASEEKIKKLMGFLVNEMKLKPCAILKNPKFMQLSLEKRIIPRCVIWQLLVSNNLIRRNTSPIGLITITEKDLMEKYMRKYQDVVPELVKAHQGKIQFQGFS